MEERRLVEEHTAVCSECADRLQFTRHLKSAIESCVELHPEPDFLVQFVEAAGDLAPEERTRIERHLAICPDCRQEVRILRNLERGPGLLERLWETMATSILRPLPAAGYLAAAATAVVLLIIQPGGESGRERSMLPGTTAPTSRSFAGPVLLLQGESATQRGEPRPVAGLPTWDAARSQLLLIEFFDLGTPPQPTDLFCVQIIAAETGALVWETRVSAESFLENYTLGLVLAPGALSAGRHQVSVDDQDGQEVFRSDLIVR